MWGQTTPEVDQSQFIMGFAIIKFVVESFGEINGWNYGQLAFLYGLSVISSP